MKEIVFYFILIIFVHVIHSLNVPENSFSNNLIEATHRPANYDDKGFWQKRVEWKSRWIKEWHEKKILVPVWRKIWGPIEINEWVPLPKLPPWNPYEQKIGNVS